MRNLLLLILALYSSSVFAINSCHLLEVEIDNTQNNTSWVLTDNTECSGSDGISQCSNDHLQSPDYWSGIQYIPARSLLKFELKDSDGHGPNVHLTYRNQNSSNQELEFQVRISKQSCNNPNNGAHQSNNSEIDAGKTYLTMPTHKSSYAGGVSGWHVKSPEKGETGFVIYPPVAAEITISLPSQKNKLATQSLLEQTYNALDPELLKKFDTIYTNPLDEIDENNQTFTFYEPCTSESCWNAYCNNASSTTACS